MAEHTSWEYWQDDRPGKEGQASITSQGKLIASIRMAPAKREEAGANARLIAAAPDLLEMLEDVAAHHIDGLHARKRAIDVIRQAKAT